MRVNLGRHIVEPLQSEILGRVSHCIACGAYVLGSQEASPGVVDSLVTGPLLSEFLGDHLVFLLDVVLSLNTIGVADYAFDGCARLVLFSEGANLLQLFIEVHITQPLVTLAVWNFELRNFS